MYLPDLLHVPFCFLVTNNGGLALLMLLGLVVPNEKFAVFTIALWFALSYLDNREDAVALPEYAVHFFQGAVSRFWVEKPDTRKEGGISVLDY